jgi:hypothetical protein
LLAIGGWQLSGLVNDRWRYKYPPGPGWTDTGERFIDPENNLQMAVYLNAAGERYYAAVDR